MALHWTHFHRASALRISLSKPSFSTKHVPGGDQTMWDSDSRQLANTSLLVMRYLGLNSWLSSWSRIAPALSHQDYTFSCTFPFGISLKIVTFTNSYLGNRPTSTGQDGKERWKKPKVLYSRGLLFHWLAARDVTSIRLAHWLWDLYVTICRRFWLVSGEAARAPLAPLFLAGISFTSERQTSNFCTIEKFDLRLSGILNLWLNWWKVYSITLLTYFQFVVL